MNKGEKIMSLLKVINISHSFGDKILYKDSSFELFKGEHMGLVGSNGSGKTTLMNSLVGKFIPDKGDIIWQKDIKIGYLDQHADIDNTLTIFEYLKLSFYELYEIESKLSTLYENMMIDSSDETLSKISNYQNYLENKGFYEIESIVLKIANGLGITAIGIDKKLGELSGGQRAKVILAKLLLEKLDILLLDEPTNFLDKEHIEWLIIHLKAFKGAFIVISHDFDFLDKITTCICDIESYSIKKYSGNLSNFISQKGLQRESYIKKFKSQKKKIKKYEDYIAKNKARASTAAMARSRQKQLDKIDLLIAPLAQPIPRFNFISLPVTSQTPLIVNKLVIGYDHPLLPPLNFKVQPAQKVVITGFNGIGKSTLLQTLIGEISPISGNFVFLQNTQIGYFEQDFKWTSKEYTPIKILSEKFKNLSERQIRKYLAQCGVLAKNALQPISTLSGGEQSKVKLAILMLTKSNMLILDEPTNHLDANSKEVLKNELINWKGNIILVSHESSFYKDWTDQVLNIESLKN